MTRSKEIQICDWTAVDPLACVPLPGMLIDQRFATVAMAGDRVVGLWSFEMKMRGKTRVLYSHFTEVLPRWRRNGLASRLWLAGIERWKPDVIRATSATWRGARFLASMTVSLAGSGPRLVVDGGAYAGYFENHVRELALAALAAERAERTNATERPAALRSVP